MRGNGSVHRDLRQTAVVVITTGNQRHESEILRVRVMQRIFQYSLRVRIQPL